MSIYADIPSEVQAIGSSQSGVNFWSTEYSRRTPLFGSVPAVERTITADAIEALFEELGVSEEMRTGMLLITID